MTEISSISEKKFDALYHTLEAYNQRYTTAYLAIAGLLVVIIGWLLTNKDVVLFFKSSEFALWIYLSIIPFQLYIYISSMLRVYRVNQKCYFQLNELNYISEDIYIHHKLPKNYLLFGIGLNVFNIIIIGILVSDAHWEWL